MRTIIFIVFFCLCNMAVWAQDRSVPPEIMDTYLQNGGIMWVWMHPLYSQSNRSINSGAEVWGAYEGEQMQELGAVMTNFYFQQTLGGPRFDYYGIGEREELRAGKYGIKVRVYDEMGNYSPFSEMCYVEIKSYIVGLLNYPNPFNPYTEINFNLPKNSRVALTIYNGLGQKMATLVDGERVAGNHRIVWDAINVPSGVYFCRLEADGFAQTIKMILMK